MRYVLPALLLLLSCCIQEKPLPVLGEVPRFESPIRKAARSTGASLDGHVWIADFIFTIAPALPAHELKNAYPCRSRTDSDVKRSRSP